MVSPKPTKIGIENYCCFQAHFCKNIIRSPVPLNIFLILNTVLSYKFSFLLLYKRREIKGRKLTGGYVLPVMVGRLSLHTSQVAHQAGASPGFSSMKRLGVFLLPPGWHASPSGGYPTHIKFAGTHLYTWVERGTVRVKCLAQEHNTMSPARARTQTTRCGVERTNHEATAPPILSVICRSIDLIRIWVSMN